jgi:hypothetical protein
MNWIFETYSNVYQSVANVRQGAPTGGGASRRSEEQRARWQGFIARRS